MRLSGVIETLDNSLKRNESRERDAWINKKIATNLLLGVSGQKTVVREVYNNNTIFVKANITKLMFRPTTYFAFYPSLP